MIKIQLCQNRFSRSEQSDDLPKLTIFKPHSSTTLPLSGYFVSFVLFCLCREFIMLSVLEAKSVGQGKVLALVESVLGLVAERSTLVQALEVLNQVSSAPVAVVERDLVFIHVLLGS